MKFYTPLRYPGGKGKLACFMQEVIEVNGIGHGHYVEPFAGGAGVALSLLFLEYVKEIHINDIDRSIYSFWYSVLNYNQELCELISSTEITIDEWEKQKEKQRVAENKSLELGFSTFFLNRANHSGIIKGGPIGGKKQEGKWKVDARFNKDDLIRRIKKIGRYKSRIHLYNLEARTLLTNIKENIPSQSLIYLDPPYYFKASWLYENHFRHEDHINLSRFISQELSSLNWIVSYDNVPEILAMYKPYRKKIYSLNYSISKASKGSEAMFFSPELQVPEVENPAKLKVF